MRFFFSRLAQALLTLFVAVAAIFVSVRALPGNPLLVRYGQHPAPAAIAAEMERRGWNDPLWVQFGRFAWSLVAHGDLGHSLIRPTESVTGELRRHFPATCELTVAALIVALPLGLALGIGAAIWRNRWPDHLCTAVSLFGVSVPVFFLGLILMAVFTGLPTGMRLSPGNLFEERTTTGLLVPEAVLRGEWGLAWEALRHLLLPALALSSIPLAMVARLTRSGMLEVLAADYIRTARAKGAPPWRVVLRHALPNAAVPVANIAGMQIGMLLSGAVLTETVFSWPGLGRYLADAVTQRDYAAVQGGALAVAGIFVLLNLSLDWAFAWLDPRISNH